MLLLLLNQRWPRRWYPPQLPNFPGSQWSLGQLLLHVSAPWALETVTSPLLRWALLLCTFPHHWQLGVLPLSGISWHLEAVLRLPGWGSGPVGLVPCLGTSRLLFFLFVFLLHLLLLPWPLGDLLHRRLHTVFFPLMPEALIMGIEVFFAPLGLFSRANLLKLLLRQSFTVLQWALSRCFPLSLLSTMFLLPKSQDALKVAAPALHMLPETSNGHGVQGPFHTLGT